MFLISSDYYTVKKTKHKGNGAFAKKDIAAGTVIGDYLGIIRKSEDIDEEKEGLYEMELTDEVSIMPDKNSEGIHMINFSCTPNCNMYIYNHHILYCASRKIFTGEELTVDYLLGTLTDESTPCPHRCICESILCRGTMHDTDRVEDISEVLDKINEKNVTEMLVFELDKPYIQLAKYPEKVNDVPGFDLYANLDLSPLYYDYVKLPSRRELRKIIRETGRSIGIKGLNLTIVGIYKEHLICK